MYALVSFMYSTVIRLLCFGCSYVINTVKIIANNYSYVHMPYAERTKIECVQKTYQWCWTYMYVIIHNAMQNILYYYNIIYANSHSSGHGASYDIKIIMPT